jgi:hypothetical protein
VAEKDYSGTPLSRKLGAKAGAAITVLLTTSREELEPRFPELKQTLAPADGLWVAWPKKASAIDGAALVVDEAVLEADLLHRIEGQVGRRAGRRSGAPSSPRASLIRIE